MTNRSIELEAALRLALEALVWVDTYSEPHRNTHKAIIAIKEALMSVPEGAQQCVCGEPNSAGTHRTDGPCLAPQPEHLEPVAHSVVEPLRPDEYQRRVSVKWVGQPVAGPLYTTPPQRTAAEGEDTQRAWIGLTNDDWDEIFGNALTIGEAIKVTEAKLKAKNFA